jgi:hypothetical protein
MYLSDPEEIETVLAFFHAHLGKELEIAVSVFPGLTQFERMRVVQITKAPTEILLQESHAHRQMRIDPHHYSFVTVAPDHTKLELGRLLVGNVTMRVTVSEVR